MNIVILGLSITSSWGNSQATMYRGLVRELNNQGHQVTFLERDVLRYANHRDLPNPEYCQLELYTSLDDLSQRFTEQLREADLVLVGSSVPEGVKVGDWVIKYAHGVKAFYDTDTLGSLTKLAQNDFEYLHPNQIPKYDLYLSDAGGATLGVLERKYGSPKARPLYCFFDPTLYYPELTTINSDLGYLAPYSEDRQKPLEKLMLDAARQWKEGRFVVAGSQYPESINWPENTTYLHHLPTSDIRHFYNSLRFSLNITRADKLKAGYSPSVRLFEAAACCTPIISDNWDGLDSFFKRGEEILVAKSAKDTLSYLREICKSERKMIGERARKKVLSNHTASHRALELVGYVEELMAVDKAESSMVS